MKIFVRTLVLFALFAIVAACAPPAEPEQPAAPAAPTKADVMKAAKDLAVRWDEGINGANTDALLAIYGADPVMMPPYGPAREGAEEIRGYLSDMFSTGNPRVVDIVADVRGGGEWAVAHGTYTLTTTMEGAEPAAETGKWMSLFHRQPDGTWTMPRNMWNSDTPPSGKMMEQEAGAEKAGEMVAEMEEAPSVCIATPAELAEAFEKSLVAGNAGELVAQHTPEALRMPPEEKTVAGASALAAYFQSAIDNYEPRQIDVEQTGIQEMGDMAAHWGTYSFDYTPKAGGKHLADSGKWFVLSKKDKEGCWRQVWAIWNSDNPAMTAGS